MEAGPIGIPFQIAIALRAVAKPYPYETVHSDLIKPMTGGRKLVQITGGTANIVVTMLEFNLVVDATAGGDFGLNADDLPIVGAKDGKWVRCFPMMPDSGRTNPDPVRTTRSNNALPIVTMLLENPIKNDVVVV